MFEEVVLFGCNHPGKSSSFGRPPWEVVLWLLFGGLRERNRRVQKPLVVSFGFCICLTWPNGGSAGWIIPEQLKLSELLASHHHAVFVI